MLIKNTFWVIYLLHSLFTYSSLHLLVMKFIVKKDMLQEAAMVYVDYYFITIDNRSIWLGFYNYLVLEALDFSAPYCESELFSSVKKNPS